MEFTNQQSELIYQDLKPRFKKLGTAENEKIVFNIIDVSEYLSQTVEVA